MRNMVRGQMKIQQMAVMIVAVFFFFVLVGLFFLGIVFKDVKGSAGDLQRAQAISSMSVIADMPELNYDSSWSMSVDEDKLRIMSGEFGDSYDLFWPVASVGVYKVYPRFDEIRKCPGVDCNYYEIYSNGQKDVKTYSAYVSICRKVRESGSTYDDCEIGKLVVGVLGGRE
ncbi:MAG: hypothetical protein V1889_01310 [archaeon]